MRCNPGQSNENGSLKSRHDPLKTALDHALRQSGSRAFDDRAGYEAFIHLISQHFNARTTEPPRLSRSPPTFERMEP